MTIFRHLVVILLCDRSRLSTRQLLFEQTEDLDKESWSCFFFFPFLFSLRLSPMGENKQQSTFLKKHWNFCNFWPRRYAPSGCNDGWSHQDLKNRRLTFVDWSSYNRHGRWIPLDELYLYVTIQHREDFMACNRARHGSRAWPSFPWTAWSGFLGMTSMDQRQLIVHFNDTCWNVLHKPVRQIVFGSPFLSVNTCFIWSQLSHKGITVCNTDMAAALQPVNKVPIDDRPVGLSAFQCQTHIHLWDWTPCDVTKGTESSPGRWHLGNVHSALQIPFPHIPKT